MRALVMLSVVILVMAAGLLYGTPALGQDASCFVAPAMEKTHLFVREIDQDGNPLGEVGSGWVNAGERMPVNSQTGKIVINYRLSSSDKRFKMDPTDCANGSVISVP